jgi:hypothetical protein
MSSRRTHIQRDFSAGEISGRMLMRADTDAYKRGAIEMVNFYPTLLGSARRAPGSRFMREIMMPDGEGGEASATAARVIPYLTRANERSLAIFTPGSITLTTEIGAGVGENVVLSDGLIAFRKQIVPNPEFGQRSAAWDLEPGQYISANGEGPLGVWWQPGLLVMIARYYEVASDSTTATAKLMVNVDTATDAITLDYRFVYAANRPLKGGYVFNVKVGTTEGGSNVWNFNFSGDVGTIRERTLNVALPTSGWTGDLYITITLTAQSSEEEKWSTPHFRVERFGIFANGVVATEDQAPLTTPYTASDLQDLHYIQSPYGDKELVVTHPRHAPRRLYFDTGGGSYVFEEITFTNAPVVWAADNYPATCTSYHGRLILAGGNSYEVLGSPITSATETVWGTEVGEWDTFTADAVNPDDSIEFTAIYRSPIQWVHGHKSLLVGAMEMEYIATGDSIFSPGDLGVNLHSTHGSSNVQPAAFGEGVIFAAEGGTKVRSMSYDYRVQGWTAPDLTLLNPGICAAGIVRMARMRNPHQMCLVLTRAGEIAVFTSESGVSGWSRYRLAQGIIRDLCVQADENGVDVAYLVVERRVAGNTKLFLEAIPNWRETGRWDYTSSTVVVNLETEGNTISGLNHLDGKRVQVYDNTNSYGTFVVSDGQVELTDQAGNPITVALVRVGLLNRCYLKTLPPESADPGAKMRYRDFSVRVLYSSNPIINGERPAERNPSTPLDQSQPVSVVNDIGVSKMGWDPYQVITIEEDQPVMCEILGVYGDLVVNS